MRSKIIIPDDLMMVNDRLNTYIYGSLKTKNKTI
jgi:hypothetical protein